MRGNRLRQVEQYILENDTVSLEDIGASFGVSINTVRRDIAELIREGRVEKIYGGARARRKSPLIPFEERHLRNMDLKQAIGECAARFVEDGDILYVDSGTTTVKLIEALGDSLHLTLVTNSLSALVAAVPFKNISVITVAGQLDRKTNSFIGDNTLRSLEAYNVKKAFMAATGLSIETGATNSSLLEYEIKSRLAHSSAQVYLMVDSSKFGVSSLTTYARIEDFHTIITDRMPPPEMAAYCQGHGVELAICGDDWEEEES